MAVELAVFSIGSTVFDTWLLINATKGVLSVTYSVVVVESLGANVNHQLLFIQELSAHMSIELVVNLMLKKAYFWPSGRFLAAIAAFPPKKSSRSVIF